MKKLALVSAVLILGGLAGVLWMVSRQEIPNDSRMMTQTDNKSVGLSDDKDKSNPPDEIRYDSNYRDYEEFDFAKNSNQKRVLFFHASWCPTCKIADRGFLDNLELIPKDVIVYKVSYNDDFVSDEDQVLARKYGITYQHTYVIVDEMGEAVKKWNGGGVEELTMNLEND